MSSTNANAAPTQVKHPNRAMIRTVFAVIVAGGPLVPLVYQAATNHDPAAAGGVAAAALGVAAGVTRVLALPAVETFLARFLPWLAADPYDAKHDGA